jgi:hypothetical protein
MPGGRAVVDRADLTSADREHSEQNASSVEYERDALPVELDQAGSSLGLSHGANSCACGNSPQAFGFVSY